MGDNRQRKIDLKYSELKEVPPVQLHASRRHKTYTQRQYEQVRKAKGRELRTWKGYIGNGVFSADIQRHIDRLKIEYNLDDNGNLL